MAEPRCGGRQKSHYEAFVYFSLSLFWPPGPKAQRKVSSTNHLIMQARFFRFVLVALAGLLISMAGRAQDSTITIGLKPAPPFVMEPGATGKPSGLSLEFWDLINDDLPARIEYRYFSSLDSLLAAVHTGQVDMSINPITVTDERMKRMDFSQPFYISGTTLVRPAQNSFWAFLQNFFSVNFWRAAALLLGVLFIVGLIMWLVERKRNEAMFHRGLKGLGDGFWWSAVTMTTVGYGDKAPATPGGRVVGFVWMFAAILIISGITASIASSLTVQTLEEKITSVEDLRRFETGTVNGSSTEGFLKLYGVRPQSFASIEAALEALRQGKLEAVVYDRPILKHQLQQSGAQDLALSSQNLKTDYYSFAYPRGSQLRAALDPLIVRGLKSEVWARGQ